MNEFIINTSFSKKELINIIVLFGFNTNVSELDNLDKGQIKCILKDYIEQIESDEEFEDNDLYIEDKKELKNYLENYNQHKITISQKNDIIKISKEILWFIKNKRYIFFKDKQDLFNECQKIAQYGDIPSVFKAIKKINENNYFEDKIKINITPKKLYNLYEKHLDNKIKNSVKFNYNNQKYVIKFN
jgi:hypothetical protein